MDPLVDRVRELLKKLDEAIERLRSVIEGTLAKVPDLLEWVFDKVRDGWSTVVGKLEQFWAMVIDFFSYVGNPVGLNDAATTWRSDVAGRAANLVRDIEDVDLAVDDEWQGRAADQYRQGVPSQRDAIASLGSDFANPIAEAMEMLRNGIVVFWAGVVVAIIAIIAGFATATGAAVTVLGIPLAPPAALAGLAIGMGSIAGTLAALYTCGLLAKDKIVSTASGIRTWPQLAI